MANVISLELKRALIEKSVSSEVISSLEITIKNSIVNHYAYAYASEISEAYRQFGMEGVKTQILYMLSNLKSWKGDEARHCKQVLRDWIIR